MKRRPTIVFLPPLTATARSLGSVAGRSPAPTDKFEPAVAGPKTWSIFWQEFAVEGEAQERCHVPGDGQAAVDQHWSDFGDSLPSRAHVIDLGCGAGIVGRALLGHRSDLSVSGVDWADVPIAPLPNLTIHPRACMETLPFEEGCFDAACSLFGIEYSNIAKTARELGRVLKPGARYSFLVHHRESEIHREGSARREALQEIMSGKMKAAFLAGIVAGLDQHRRRLKEQFLTEPMVNLVSDHLRRNIFRTRAERETIWRQLASGLDPEVSLLMHMEQSAKSPAELGSWLAALLSTMRTVSVSALQRSSGEPIAWHVSGVR